VFNDAAVFIFPVVQIGEKRFFSKPQYYLVVVAHAAARKMQEYQQVT